MADGDDVPRASADHEPYPARRHSGRHPAAHVRLRARSHRQLRHHPHRCGGPGLEDATRSVSTTEAGTHPFAANPGSCTAGVVQALVDHRCRRRCSAERTAPKPPLATTDRVATTTPSRRSRAARSLRSVAVDRRARREPEAPAIPAVATASTITLSPPEGARSHRPCRSAPAPGMTSSRGSAGHRRRATPLIQASTRPSALSRSRRRAGADAERELAAQQRHRAVDLARDADDLCVEFGALTPASTTSGSLQSVQPSRVATRTAYAAPLAWLKRGAPTAMPTDAAPRRSPARRAVATLGSGRRAGTRAAALGDHRSPTAHVSRSPAAGLRAGRARYCGAQVVDSRRLVGRRGLGESPSWRMSFRRRRLRRKRTSILKRFSTRMSNRIGANVSTQPGQVTGLL